VDQLAGFPDADTTSFFFIFYASINTGSLLTYAVMPVARARAGFGAAFSLPMAALVLSLGAFAAARARYTRQPPTGSIFVRSWRVLAAALAQPRGEGEPLIKQGSAAAATAGALVAASNPLGAAARKSGSNRWVRPKVFKLREHVLLNAGRNKWRAFKIGVVLLHRAPRRVRVREPLPHRGRIRH
jgi:hypothetical protein